MVKAKFYNLSLLLTIYNNSLYYINDLSPSVYNLMLFMGHLIIIRDTCIIIEF